MLTTRGDARSTSAVPAVLVATFAPGLLLVAALVSAAGRGYAVVHQCVPVSGLGAWAGTQLALVRTCGPGGVTLGSEAGGATHVIAALALPVLLAHLVGLLVAWGGTRALRRGVARTPGVVLRRLRAAVGLLVLPHTPERSWARPAALGALRRPRRPGVHVTIVPWRGPPAVLALV